ncbi:MAG: hypothetical protein AAFZ80_09735 [Cyanobacteria bacterium P01_A01_bin.105]
MTDIYDLLDKIHHQPGLYLGTPTITGLYMFLNGYSYARQDQGLPLTQQEKSFEQFQIWVQHRFQVKAAISWAKIILLHAADERSGFDLFFDLLTQFKVALKQPSAPHRATL